ncbi:hypothetical protein SH467x_002166 [Pirellulaceae bacterium SH467]
MDTTSDRFPQWRWPQWILRAAGIYNLVWGVWVILFPHLLFDWTGIPRLNHPGIWQAVGMIVGVYGIGYWIAATNVLRHWPIVLVGFLGKIFGPIGFLGAALRGELPWSWGVTILTNDLIWWLPFAAILYGVFKSHSDPSSRVPVAARGGLEPRSSLEQGADAILPRPQSSNGKSIDALSSDRPILLVFIRHAGCTFCRETLAVLASRLEEIHSLGLVPVVVHMSSLEEGERLLISHGLKDTIHISDPGCVLYRQYQLGRGTVSQLFGPSVWWKGFQAAILRGHGVGKLSGDGFQLGGAAIVDQGRTIQVFPAADAATSLPVASELRATLQCAAPIPKAL